VCPMTGSATIWARLTFAERTQAQACVLRKRLAFAYKLNIQASARIVGSSDVQLAHLVLERRTFESEALSCSAFAGYSSGPGL
jgi:hypothetical protein